MGKKLLAAAFTGIMTFGIPAAVGYFAKKTTCNVICDAYGVKNANQFYEKAAGNMKQDDPDLDEEDEEEEDEE